MDLSRLGEFGLIGRIAAVIGGREADASGVMLGVGDDAAAFRPTPGRLLVATADMLVEEIHFRRDWFSPRDLGWKSLAVNLSDCAAMAAEPRFALVCAALDAHTPPEYVLSLYEGMQELASYFGVRIAGGDTVAARAGITLSVTAAGEVEPEHLATRAGAQVGDVVLVTGTLGDSAAGCAALLAGPEMVTRVPEAVLRAHRLPQPRVREARAAALAGGVTAMIDLSDGVAGDLRHICEESGVGVEVRAADVPISAECRLAAAALGRDPLHLALTGGEDYELLLTVSPERAPAVIAAITSATGTPVTAIGEIRESDAILLRADGTRAALPVGGYRHFQP